MRCRLLTEADVEPGAHVIAAGVSRSARRGMDPVSTARVRVLVDSPEDASR